MKLYILRHGEAAEHGDPRYKENDRPLTQKGTQRTRQLAHALREMEISFDLILSSPLTRAKQTAEIVARGLDEKVTFSDTLTPSGNMQKLVEEINGIHPLPKSALLVGHEPYLSVLISMLCIGGPDLPIKMKKGALCRMEIDKLTSGKCAVLEWLLQPRLIGFKASKRDVEKQEAEK
jgi:phosphohistidine phosphatase